LVEHHCQSFLSFKVRDEAGRFQNGSVAESKSRAFYRESARIADLIRRKL
jgi:hypothetical protein